ncbi:uncharacterized protein RAG0_15379 [Rhynchosporium agropyri]|uniref:Cation-transporting P-type ATPase C-terminal domain-containing protein n=1 Tax=Rhynchosporium agropyri TaxID=914238 RepID=A0A1E1LKW3_9HELO|nr:uncharacterized protein RAG0_15379 [Rhynchosporium agropyri]
MFLLDPTTNSRFPFFKDVYENKFLFWSVMIGAVSVFSAVYIPYLNTRVFKHTGITWDWTLSFGAIFVFVLGIEGWKAIKRSLRLFEAGSDDDKEHLRMRRMGPRQGFFTMAKSQASSIPTISRRATNRSRDDMSFHEKAHPKVIQQGSQPANGNERFSKISGLEAKAHYFSNMFTTPNDPKSNGSVIVHCDHNDVIVFIPPQSPSQPQQSVISAQLWWTNHCPGAASNRLSDTK